MAVSQSKKKKPATKKPAKKESTAKKPAKKKLAKSEQLAKSLIKQRPQLKAQLDRLLAHYGSQKEHGAFAQALNGRCSACNVGIAFARMQLIKAGEFLDCASCGRFLYFEEE